MKILSLDTGMRHTGVAFYDDSVGIVLPLQTIDHQTDQELVDTVRELCSKRAVTQLVVGWPLLPSGNEGQQVKHVRGVETLLQSLCIPIDTIDERYTNASESGDDHSAAACEILRTWIQKL